MAQNEEWTMDVGQMEDIDRVTEQSLQVLHRFSSLESASTIVLEVGAGRGRASLYALSRLHPGVELWLTDYSDSMVEHMKQVVDAMDPPDPRVKVLKVNAVDLQGVLPRPDQVDVYLANLCLHHCSDMEKALREAFRVLKPGGRAAIAELDVENKGTMFEIAEECKKIAGISSKHHHHHGHQKHHDHDHNHGHKHHHGHHQHGHANEEHGHKHHHGPHKHGNQDELRRLLCHVGFVNVVAWKISCVGEIEDASRYATMTRKRIAAELHDEEASSAEQLDALEQELRRLATVELEAGRPLTLGCVVLIARKPID